MKKRVRKIIRYGLLIALIGGAVFYFTNRQEKPVEYATVKAVKADLVQTVSETGTVKSAESFELKFPNTGIIASTSVKTGDRVTAGKVLAELDYKALSIQERDALANLNSAKAQLAKLLAGATASERKVAETSVASARAAYERSVKEKQSAEATVKESIAQASSRLADLKSAAVDTAEEQAVAVAQTSLGTVVATYKNTMQNRRDSALLTASDKVTAAYVALDDVRKILENDTTAFKKVYSAKNSSLPQATKTSYELAKEYWASASAAIGAAQDSEEKADVLTALNQSITFITQAGEALKYCFQSLESTVTSLDFSQTSLDAYKATISADITVVNTGLSAVKTAEQSYQDSQLSYDTNLANAQETLRQAQANKSTALTNAQNALSSAKRSGDQQLTAAATKVESAKKALDSAEADFARITSKAESYDIASAQARVQSAQASVDSIRNQIDNSRLKAPVEGVVTDVLFDRGEYVSPANTVVTMLGKNDFEVRIDISESDIKKIKIGDPCEVTFDAFDQSDIVYGTAYFIDPAQTVIQDVVYYGVKVRFYSENDLAQAGIKLDAAELANYKMTLGAIKSGMTANVTIKTAERPEVIAVPSRAIIDKGPKERIVRVLIADAQEERAVETGLRGDGGMVEVVSGIKEGDLVITGVRSGEK